MTESYYSSRQFLSNNFDDQIEGRRSHQIFSFNPAGTTNQQRNTVQDRRDIDHIMKRYSNPQGPFQNNLASQQIQQSTSDQNKGPVNFLNSQNFDEVELKQQNSQKFQVNYPNLLDDDTSLMTSLNNDTQIYNGVENPFMKNYDNSVRTDADDLQDGNQNYDKFHQFEHLDLNKMANQVKQSNNQQERVTFGFNNANIFDTRQSQVNNGGQAQNNQQSQVYYSTQERESQYSSANQNIKMFSSPTNNQTYQSQNFSMAQQSGQFGLQSQAANFGGQSKNIEYSQKDDTVMILKNINNNNDFDDNNIFGSDEDLTKQEEQEQRVNQMHAEISVLNDQVHKMLSTYKNQLEKQSDKRQVKQNVKKDASLLSKNYRDIISKFEDLSQNDISMISNNSINSRNNMSSFAGYSLLKGTTKKEKEVNVMMNLVEQFLCKFDDDFQNQSVSRQNKQKQQQNQQQQQVPQKQQQQQDEQYKKILRDQQQYNEIQKDFKRLSLQQNQLEQPKKPQLAQQYQIQNQNRHTLPTTNNKPQDIESPPISPILPNKSPSIIPVNHIFQPSEQIEGRSTAQFNVANNDLTTQFAKQPQGILSNQQSSQSNSTAQTQNTFLEMDKILQQHKKDHQDNPFLSVAQSHYNTSTPQTYPYSQGNTPTNQPSQSEIFFNGSFQPQIGQKQLIEQEEDQVKRTQLPQLRQVSSAQAPNTPSSASTNPVSQQPYSQSTRTSGVNQINFTNNITTDQNQQISNHYLVPQKPPNFTINTYSNAQPNSQNNTPSNALTGGYGVQQQFTYGSTLQIPNNQTYSTQVNTPKTNNNILNANQLNSNTRNSGYFNTHDQLDLYCTNCDKYFQSNVYFEHVKSCDKEYSSKVNQILDDTFYNLEQSTAIINKLDQKIDKISKNITNVLQLQNLPQTSDILKDTIRDLADTLKSENSSVVKKIIKKIEQNTKQLDTGNGNISQSSSYKLYQYLKRVTNILREKETALEQSAMLKEINQVYPSQKPLNINNQQQAQPALQQQQQQQNFYAPRYSYQPNNNNTVNLNNNFTRNTISTNQELNQKSKFYDLAGQIKNNLPANHSGSSYLISELYEEAKNLQENQWQSYLQQKFNINN